ncbi:hypothetical protein [Streptomyces sp. Z26]|uniref:hypothetical protein n=1 Tax=Streptomyces sp. Z26 TaxID=2500177 RepID=UPI000EF15F1E|nr:hypothetical protein [Streptomyces sp. Z26]RLL67011.1 hypothetical protein D7M15_09185 [Streptomyces sp. Z26]
MNTPDPDPVSLLAADRRRWVDAYAETLTTREQRAADEKVLDRMNARVTARVFGRAANLTGGAA